MERDGKASTTTSILYFYRKARTDSITVSGIPAVLNLRILKADIAIEIFSHLQNFRVFCSIIEACALFNKEIRAVKFS